MTELMPKPPKLVAPPRRPSQANKLVLQGYQLHETRAPSRQVGITKNVQVSASEL